MLSAVRRFVDGGARAGRWALMLGALTLAAPGCGKPCEDLADHACERAGEGSETCLTIRDKAGKASSEDQRACRKALDMVVTLGKNK